MKEHKYKVGDLLEVTEDGVVGTMLKEAEIVEVTGFGDHTNYNVKDSKGREWLLYEQNLRIRKIESKTEVKFLVMSSAGLRTNRLFMTDTYQKAEKFCQEYDGHELIEIKKYWFPKGAKDAVSTN